ncbi:MAG: thioredoxin family protein [Prevotella sp.]|nr:thioredoxin family protein [Prevotella sp.]
MKKKIMMMLFALVFTLMANAQTTSLRPEANKKVYDETIDPIEQIDQAVSKAKAEGKHVVCQVGGNWCPWCLRFAYFITSDTTINQLIADNFVYIHVNYDPRKSRMEAQSAISDSASPIKRQPSALLMERLNHPARFGFPVFVVLNGEGKVIHIQDSSFLEEGESYNKEKVIRFFKNWTPRALE